MRAIVLPNDPISAYLSKGEVIERYFNPKDIFDRIDIVSLNDSDVAPEEAKIMAGRAALNIYPAGKITFGRVFFPDFYVRQIVKKLDIKGADVIIAHNSNIAGYVAAWLGRIFRIPVIISLHTNPDKDVRAHIKWIDVKHKLFWEYSSVFLEKFALRNASRVICAYEFIKSYVLARGVESKKVNIVYHRIALDRFKRNGPIKIRRGDPLKILCVGRVFERKNPENIVKAIKDLNAELTLIGDGSYLGRIMALAKEIGVGHKVTFLKSVPNAIINNYYHNCHIFASINDYGGVSKPVMEAMAASLPIVLKSPLWEDLPELIEDVALITDGSVYGFREVFEYLLGEPDALNFLGAKSFEKIREIGGDVMEQKEADIILSVTKERRK